MHIASAEMMILNVAKVVPLFQLAFISFLNSLISCILYHAELIIYMYDMCYLPTQSGSIKPGQGSSVLTSPTPLKKWNSNK